MSFGNNNGMTLRIDRAGRIVVPKPIRDRLGLRAGMDLELAEGPDGIVLRRPGRSPRLVKKGRLLVYAGPVRQGYDLSRAVEADRESRMGEVWQR